MKHVFIYYFFLKKTKMEEHEYSVEDFYGVRSIKTKHFNLPNTVVIEIVKGNGEKIHPFTMYDIFCLGDERLTHPRYTQEEWERIKTEVQGKMVGKSYETTEESTFYYVIFNENPQTRQEALKTRLETLQEKK